MELRIGHTAEPDDRTAGSAEDSTPGKQGSAADVHALRAGVAIRIRHSMFLSAYLPSLGGLAILAGTIVYLAWLFWPVAPRHQLVPWLVYMAGIIVALVAALLIDTKLRPREPYLRFWRDYFSVLNVARNVGVAASVWILLPAAGPSLKIYMVPLYVWYLIVQLLATRDARAMFISAVSLTIGSLVVFWLTQDVPMREAITAFLIMFGVTTLLLQHAMDRTVRDAMTARYLAEDAHLQLAAALSEVSAERDAKARFIAAASHDLQQPIQAARLYFEQLATATPSARARPLAGGREAFRAVQTLLEDMLEHLRLEARTVKVRPEPVALEPLYAELALQYAPSADAAGIRIVTQPTACVALADRRLLRRALGNLIDNAIKHSGGRRIEVSSGPSGDGAVEIGVRDDGCGISAENAARLFEQDFGFRRAAGASAPGFGLGLPSARRIADLFGGTLQLASDPGRGCDFRLVLPRAPGTSH